MRKSLLFTIALPIMLVVGVMAFTSASAVDLFSKCSEAECSSVNENKLGPNGKNVIWNAVQILLIIVGGASVIMIIVGGIRYAISTGDASAIGAAKKTILYSIIGLIVAISAWAIVGFIIDKFK